jgi:hypothetical protein
MRDEVLIAHRPVAMAIITLFLSQMATLENSISTYFGKRVVAWERRRLTCEAPAIANLCKGPGRKRSRDNKTRRDDALFHQGPRLSAERYAHPTESDPGLGIATGQRALEKWMRSTAPT